MVLDIGEQDDLQVVRFHAKERDHRGTYRWTRALSYLSLIGVPADTQRLCYGWTTAAGRGKAPPAEVEAFIGEISLGRVVVGAGMQAYTLAIPAEVARAAAASPDAVTVRLRTVTWHPRAVLRRGRRSRARCYGGPRGGSPRALTAGAQGCSTTSISTRRPSAGRGPGRCRLDRPGRGRSGDSGRRPRCDASCCSGWNVSATC